MTDSRIEPTIDFLRERVTRAPAALIVLGSGLSGVADEIGDPLRIPYAMIPGFPRTTVEGHRGELVAGVWAGVEVVVMLGRFHYYEGWSSEDVTVPIRAIRALGADRFVVTNAAGAIRSDLAPGDLMLIADHLNLMFRNPLIGPTVIGEHRFPDMTDAYDPAAREAAKAAARQLGIGLREGVYAGVTGPSFETPAEIEMMRRFGADAVGMSTVPEVIVARALAMRVLGISCITNAAPGPGRPGLTHTEVLEVAAKSSERMTSLLRAVLPRIAPTNLPTEAAD